MDAAVPALIDTYRHGRPGHLVRVAELAGFGLRDATEGAVVAGGSVRGRLLSGLADDAVVRAAAAGDRVLRTTITDRAAEGAGLVCGGVATLVLTPTTELPPELLDWLVEARPTALATWADAGSGAMAITARAHAGSLGDDHADQVVVGHGRQLLEAGSSGRLRSEVGGRPILVSAVAPPTRVLIVGSGPMADAIAAQAELLGWIPQATDELTVAEAFVAAAGPADAVVVLSHDPAVDTAVLAAAVTSGAGYVGAMGSRATQSARRTRLLERGLDDGALARIHGPVGLDLGARTPPETAVAIVAEVLADRGGRPAASLRGRPGPING